MEWGEEWGRIKGIWNPPVGNLRSQECRSRVIYCPRGWGWWREEAWDRSLHVCPAEGHRSGSREFGWQESRPLMFIVLQGAQCLSSCREALGLKSGWMAVMQEWSEVCLGDGQAQGGGNPGDGQEWHWPQGKVDIFLLWKLIYKFKEQKVFWRNEGKEMLEKGWISKRFHFKGYDQLVHLVLKWRATLAETRGGLVGPRRLCPESWQT